MLHSVRTNTSGAFTAAARCGAPRRSSGASVHLQPCDHRGQRCCTRRGGGIPVSFTQGKDNSGMFSSWQHACQLRDAVLRPRSLQYQRVVRVHVNGWNSSGRHAGRVAQSLRETRRRGRSSALPVPGLRKTQSPCRLRWRRGPLLPSLVVSDRPAAHGVDSGRTRWALQDKGDECCSQSELRVELPGKAAEDRHAHAGAGRWAHAEGGGRQEFSAGELQALAR
ncbi:hypothetical protein TcCL_Unassigned00950 [Trypanosoma cruzi]|uniref:Uncharacterized protein n=1 Tax=Trypanosoma cruzi (strain CL Brener) TaxID=353153 RepID=Q4CVT4_TRYCC|nr:hypothetical protein Tc00.1047053507731.30 [Trypanosoma cruzi]EAN84387.1 hypothetical protein Tc00.1047053507731.30 [Trypanosoma cruzi]RNC36105.1 hypothetical protein TcCL_Unassigned00950 [Trypanosoma cruzi]|eukprot:XP_806238.1 hypothetical protein [Trypanosoma cruzi strain CL Brener]